MTQTPPRRATSPISDLKKRANPTGGPIPSLPLAKVLLVVNPVAGSRLKRKKLARIIAHLRHAASALEIIYTTAAQDATRLIREKRKEGWTLLLCAGGDGTINETVNGMLDEDDHASDPSLSPLLEFYRPEPETVWRARSACRSIPGKHIKRFSPERPNRSFPVK